ncbi:unnamed protein product [Schistosoma curassoni]|uniref:Regulatory protein zeste n=1 Tax=Schistosoma curassoni TaxID=6186 RepID=A0A183KZM1_9TREM|nr:unnamed protein product [Schistosoma curassoni]
MESPDNVGNWEYQSNCNENEEIQLGSAGNQRNQLDPVTKRKMPHTLSKINEFKIDLNNRLQALQGLRKEEETTMEDNWKNIKEALTSACQEILGNNKHHHKEWISIETLDMIKERKNKKTAINNSRTRAEKVQAQAEYIEANKQVKKSIKANKQKYMEELATTAEKAVREVNLKQIYDTKKKPAGTYSKQERLIKNKEDRPITETQEQTN